MPTFAELVASTDLAVLRNLGGEVVTYSPADVMILPVPVIGMFDDQFQLAQGSAQAGVEAMGPAVFFRLEDLPTDPMVDKPTMAIRGNIYRVVERMPDGMGGIVLALRRVT